MLQTAASLTLGNNQLGGSAPRIRLAESPGDQCPFVAQRWTKARGAAMEQNLLNAGEQDNRATVRKLRSN